MSGVNRRSEVVLHFLVDSVQGNKIANLFLMCLSMSH